MGEGWSWIQRPGTERDHAAEALEGRRQVRSDLEAPTYGLYALDEFTYPVRWGWVDVAEVVEVLRDRSGSRHVVVTGRNDGGHRSDGGATWQRLRVSGRKVGPGYIDPSYHAVAAGRPGRNRTRGW